MKKNISTLAIFVSFPSTGTNPYRDDVVSIIEFNVVP